MRRAVRELETELEGDNFMCNWVAQPALIKPLKVNTPIHMNNTIYTHTLCQTHCHQRIMTEAQVGAGPGPRTRPPVRSLNPPQRSTSKARWRHTDIQTHLPLLPSCSHYCVSHTLSQLVKHCFFRDSQETKTELKLKSWVPIKSLSVSLLCLASVQL